MLRLSDRVNSVTTTGWETYFLNMCRSAMVECGGVCPIIGLPFVFVDSSCLHMRMPVGHIHHGHPMNSGWSARYPTSSNQFSSRTWRISKTFGIYNTISTQTCIRSLQTERSAAIAIWTFWLFKVVDCGQSVLYRANHHQGKTRIHTNRSESESLWEPDRSNFFLFLKVHFEGLISFSRISVVIARP